MDCRKQQNGSSNPMSAHFDAMAMLGRSYARHIRSARVTGDIGLAAWSNQCGRVRYQAPRHHTLSYYIVGSNHLRRVNSSDVGSGKGMFSLLPAGHHSEWALSGNLRFIHLYFTPPYLDTFAASVLDRHDSAIQLPEAAFGEDPYLDQLIRFVLCALDWGDNADQLALSRVADLVMLQLIKQYDLHRRRVPTRHYSLAPVIERRVKDYIETNLEQSLTIGNLAELAGLSHYHFARMFKLTTGMPVHAYVSSRRLARARDLLSETELSIVDIAARCGFSSQSHFCRRFKTATGVTPSRYRIG